MKTKRKKTEGKTDRQGRQQEADIYLTIFMAFSVNFDDSEKKI